MRSLKFILLSAILFMIAVSCSREEYDISIKEGCPATLTFNFNNVDAQVVATKGMTDPEERTIDRVYVLIFNASGDKVAAQNFINLSSGSVSMSISSGSGMQIYAIANYPVAAAGNPGILSDLASVSNLTQLRNIKLSFEGLSPSNPGYLTMIGSLTKDLVASPASNSCTIDLYYVCSKITVKFVDATTDKSVQFLTWTLSDLPKSSYLIENSNDAVNPSIETDYFSLLGDNSWEKIEVLNNQSSVSQSFYMFENRRGTSASSTYKTKTQYAPSKATYLTANLNCYNTSNGQTYSVSTKIYLGKNNSNDYNVQRKKHYTYTITFSSINNFTVDVDSNTKVVPFPIKVTTSSILYMDGHPDQREFMINADGDNVENISIEIIDQNGRTYNEAGFSATWLKVSPLNLLRHQVSQSSPANLYQQPAPSTNMYVRPRYIPHKSFREANPSQLWSEWPSVGSELYNDDEMAFSNATYRMCYKINNIPFDATGNQKRVLVVYAQENEYDGHDGDMRMGKVRISFTDKNDNSNKYIEYEVHQKQGMYFGNVVNSYTNGSNITTPSELASGTSYSRAIVEQIEESAITLHPDIDATTQGKRVMQWGYKGFALFTYNALYCSKYEEFRNGYFLTANAVYGVGTTPWLAIGNYVEKGDDGSADWSDDIPYRTKYGRGADVKEQTTISNSGAPYYIAQSNYYDPIYNTSAARYCHEKNRDLNGDGVISPSETKWYLPSQHELYQLWISIEAVRYSTTEYGTGYYWSSTESGKDNVYNLGFGSAFFSAARSKSSCEGNGNDSVRCIRKIN